MRFPRTLVFSLAAAAACASATAQTATFTGVVVRATQPSTCQEETHYLACSGPTPAVQTGVSLKSSTLNLDDFLGRLTTFDADLRGVTCDVWDVTAARFPVSTLLQCGSPFPGCDLRFRVGPSATLGRWRLFLSDAPDFVPISQTFGTLLVRRPFRKVAVGFTFGASETFELRIPADPAYVGLSFWAQGLRQDIGPIGPPELTNATCFTIGPPGPPCVLPGC